MLKYNFIFLLLVPIITFSQIQQVSNIDYQRISNDQPRKGFVTLNDTEYFIEQGYFETRISEIKTNGLELQHVINERPRGRTYQYRTGFTTENNSGLFVDGNLLLEIYWSSIYVINIETGEVESVLDLTQDDIAIDINRIRITDDAYFFYGSSDQVSKLYSWNKVTGALKAYEQTVDNANSYFDDGLVFRDNVANEIFWLDLETEATESIFKADTESLFYQNIEINGAPHLLVAEGDSSRYYLIDEDFNIEDLGCLSDFNWSNIRVLEDRLIIIETSGENYDFIVVDRNTCEVLNEYPLSQNAFYILDSREFNDDYFIVSDRSDWTGFATFYLYDVEQNTFTYLDLVADWAQTYRVIRYDDQLYILFYDDIHHIGVLPELFAIDLVSKSVKKIDDYDRYKLHDIVIGNPKDDQSFYIYYATADGFYLNRYAHAADEMETIQELDYSRNVGINFSIYEGHWHEGKFFFFTSDAMFVMENDAVEKILDFDPSIWATCSGFQVNNDILYAIGSVDSAVYTIKVNTEDLSYDLTPMNDIEKIDYRRRTTENAIINVPGFSNPATAGYLDVRDGNFKPFTYQGQSYRVWEAGVSGHNVLVDFSGQNLAVDKLLFNTLSERAAPLDEDIGEGFPDMEGGFYYFSDNNLFHLNAEGEVDLISTVESTRTFYAGLNLSGETKSIAVDAEDEMVILSMRNGEQKTIKIPDHEFQYYQHLFWKETDDISIIEISEQDGWTTQIFSFDSDPVVINEKDRAHRLKEVLIEEDKLVLIYQNQSIGKFYIEDYLFDTQEIIPRLEIDANRYENEVINVSPTEYLLVFNQFDHGSEPWLYDSEMGELNLLIDLREGFISSAPSDFMQSPSTGEIYFTAIKNAGDRQLFKYTNTVSTKNIGSEFLEVLVYPSPSEGRLTLAKQLEEVSIHDAQGKEVFIRERLSKNQRIDVTYLVAGIYYISGIDSIGERQTQKFSIVKDN